MAEYLYNAVQAVQLNQPALFSNSIPCSRGNVYHENETGMATLRTVLPSTRLPSTVTLLFRQAARSARLRSPLP